MSNKTSLELFKYYSDQANMIRRLLVTQTFAWLAGFLYFALKNEEAQTALVNARAPDPIVTGIALFIAACVACGFTFAFGHTYRYLHGFLEEIVVHAMEGDVDSGTWKVLHARRHSLRPWQVKLLDYPDILPATSFVLAAIAVYYFRVHS